VSNGRHSLTFAQFASIVQRLDELVREFEALPYPVVRERIFEALQAVDAIHREGITRLVEIAGANNTVDLLERAQQDPVVRTLLVLYDLIADEYLPELPAQESRNFIALNQLQIVPRRAKPPAFVELGAMEQVPPDTLKNFQWNEQWILVANVGGEFYAVRDQCPGSMAPLHLGAYNPPVLVCPWHNEAYDIRSGKRVDGETEPKLQVLPIFVDNGVLKLATDKASGRTLS
jgi:nitrite reductase/ring-hydroxylating ferredoxin subunit